MSSNENGVSADEFTMWRAVMAFALTDGELTLEEQKILTHHFQDEGFSETQLAALRSDMNDFHDVEELFSKIKSEDNQKRFCALARTLAWCDGDIKLQEKKILQNVNCFQKPKYKDILENSIGHTIYKNFTKMYEEASQLQDTEPHHIFAAAA